MAFSKKRLRQCLLERPNEKRKMVFPGWVGAFIATSYNCFLGRHMAKNKRLTNQLTQRRVSTFEIH